MDYPLSAMVPGNGCCMSGLWDVTVCKRFNLILKCYVFADILCRRSRTRSLQGSLQQRIDFVKAHVVWFHPLWWNCSAAPKKTFISLLKASIQIFPLMIDHWSTLDPTYTSESSVTWSAMSDEMVGPIFDEWKVSDLELESEVGSEEVDVAISIAMSCRVLSYQWWSSVRDQKQIGC